MKSVSALSAALCLLAPLANAQSSTWSKEPTSFVGIELGTEIAMKYPVCISEILGDTGKVCRTQSRNGSFDIVGAPGKFSRIEVEQANTSVGMVAVQGYASDHDEIEQALVEKYGPPQKREPYKVMLKSGLQLEEQREIWLGRDKHLVFDSFGHDADHCSVQVTTQAYREQVLRQRQERVEELVKSF